MDNSDLTTMQVKRGDICLQYSIGLFLGLKATGIPPQILPKPYYIPHPPSVEGRFSRSPYTKPIAISHHAAHFFLDGVYQALQTPGQCGYSQID